MNHMRRVIIFFVFLSCVIGISVDAKTNAPQEPNAVDGIAWLVLNYRFHSIGTEEQQAIWDTYYDIVFNPTAFREQDLVVWDAKGQRWTVMDTSSLIHMTDETQRQAFADRWLAQRPGGQAAIDDIRSQREAFKQVNLEFSNYPTYLVALAIYPGGIPAFRLHQSELSAQFQNALSQLGTALFVRGLRDTDLERALDAWTLTGEAFLICIDEGR